MTTHVGQVLDGRGIASASWISVLVRVEVLLEALANRAILYLLLTDSVEHALLVFLQLMNQIKVIIIFIL